MLRQKLAIQFYKVSAARIISASFVEDILNMSRLLEGAQAAAILNRQVQTIAAAYQKLYHPSMGDITSPEDRNRISSPPSITTVANDAHAVLRKMLETGLNGVDRILAAADGQSGLPKPL
jgi:hypothetical protein